MGIGKLRNGIVVEYDDMFDNVRPLYIPDGHKDKDGLDIGKSFVLLYSGKGGSWGKEYDIVDFNYE